MAELRIEVSEIVNQAVDKLIESGWRPSEWIPCSEMLPETNTQVLCYCRMGDFRIMEFDEQENRWYEGIHDYRLQSVTHWMPLHEPPESEVQE